MTAQAAEVLVAVAANMVAPMQDIALAFTKESGHTVKLSAGSTGKLYAQIMHGAPFHVLVSADQNISGPLERSGLAVPRSGFVYAQGHLVLWSPRPNVVDNQGKVLQQTLTKKSGHRIAWAHPSTAPYGAAALQTLRHLGLEKALHSHMVQGESVAQAYQFTASGNTAMGFVALSQVWKNGQLLTGSAWKVPPSFYAPLLQEAVLLNPGENSAAAKSLLIFLRGASSQRILKAYGYTLPS